MLDSILVLHEEVQQHREVDGGVDMCRGMCPFRWAPQLAKESSMVRVAVGTGMVKGVHLGGVGPLGEGGPDQTWDNQCSIQVVDVVSAD